MKKIKNFIKKILFSKNLKVSTFNLIIGALRNIKLINMRNGRVSTKITSFNVKTLTSDLKKNNIEDIFLDANSFEQKKDQIEKSSKILRKFGSIIIQNCFSKEEIESFLNENKELNPKLNLDNTSHYTNANKKHIPISKNPFLFDDRITKTLELSSNYKGDLNENFYLRQPSTFAYFNATKENTRNNWTGGWHVDYPSQFTVHIILENLKKSETRMQILPMTQSLPFLPGYHYELENSKFDFSKYIVDCYGPIGTLYIHSGNTLHRNYPVMNTQRFVWSQVYTMDKISFALNEKDKNELFQGSDIFLKNLDKRKQEYVKLLLYSPTKPDVEYYKFENNKYITANKSDLTYM